MTFWGKTGEGDDYLPLERHLDDTGATATRLWNVTLTSRQRAWWSSRLGEEERDAQAWVSFIAAVHDAGKANPAFQRLVPGLAERLVESELLAAARWVTDTIRHDAVTGAVLTDWLLSRGTHRRDVARLVATVSGHHAVPRRREEVRHARARILRQAPEWWPAQSALVDEVACRAGIQDRAAPHIDGVATVVVLAGLVTVADWLASDERRFPITAAARPPADELADAAIPVSSWAVPAPPDDRPFRELFGRDPRATQAVVAAAARAEAGAALFLIEDRTGAGKTEAAFAVVHRALQHGARGLYIGMPTRATADQLHARTAQFLADLWPSEDRANLRLLHGGVHGDTDAPRPSDIARDQGTPEDTEAEQWFAQGRRGLLAPFAVGTIDQALLGILHTKHYPVRLWGLHGKVVVLDEVHAYDSYTGMLLERLVGWLATLDCTVVLLSATLPSARRRTLVAAFRNGLGQASVDVEPVGSSLPYPRVTVASRARAETIGVTDDRVGRTVAIEWAPIVDDAVAVAGRAMDEVRDGGCLVVICGTVAAAQERFRALRTAPDAQGCDPLEILLLHARLRPIERGPVERRLLDLVGPPDRLGTVRPERLIVVATQVVEQSLDLDFDVLLTDLAPIDLLVQRAGRVHRHAGRARDERHRVPRMVVLDTPGSSPVRDRARSADGIYDPAVLVRTRLALSGREVLREPEDLDTLIETVYDGSPVAAVAPEEIETLDALERNSEQEQRSLESWADDAALPVAWDEDPPWEARSDVPADPDDLGVTARAAPATRWSERPSVSVVLLRPDELPETREHPRREDSVELLRRAVSLSHRRVTEPLLRAWKGGRPSGGEHHRFQPPSWRRNSRLRHHLLVELDADGYALPVVGADGAELTLPLILRDDEGVIVEDVQRDV